MRKINIHAGHNPDGKIACGAVGAVKESTEARYLVKKIIENLREHNVVVYNCTVNNGTSQSDVLKKIVNRCNQHDVDLDVSIHFNSGRNDRRGDGNIGGTEVWMRTEEGIKKKTGTKICKEMERIGFTNRGIKTTKGLYFLNHTKAPAILVEICFVDDKDDTKRYKKVRDEIANKISNVLLNL